VCIYNIRNIKEAPFMWMFRVAHPISLFRMIISMFLNAVSTVGVYSIDRNSPVRICVVSRIPSINPIFHRNEIDVGDGRSVRDFLLGL
jgi:hypothetical protein